MITRPKLWSMKLSCASSKDKLDKIAGAGVPNAGKGQSNMPNIDRPTVEGFGEEWTWYDQSGLAEDERARLFEAYFHVFPWDSLPPEAEGFDAGCGSGRWAKSVAGRVGRLHCVDANAAALTVARRNLVSFSNCFFHHPSSHDSDW